MISTALESKCISPSYRVEITMYNDSGYTKRHRLNKYILYLCKNMYRNDLNSEINGRMDVGRQERMSTGPLKYTLM